MTAICVKFSKLLIIELESLEEELEILLRSLDERLAAHEITDYVRNENHVILKNEIMGLRDFLQTGCSVDADEVHSPEDAAALAKETVRVRLEQRGYMPALYGLVARRIDKIADYLKLDMAPR